MRRHVDSISVNTHIATTESTEATELAVQSAVQHLNAGDVVGLPTETVYGLAADACNEAAVAKIFEVKGRPKFDPLIVHLPTKAALDEVAEVPEELEKAVKVLTTQFWPGPLTLLLPKKPLIPDIVTGGLDTVAVRMSEHPVFRKIAKEFGRPIAAPSANRFGRISPTSAAAVMEELSGLVPLIVDGGACGRGLESTIVRLEAPEDSNGKGKKKKPRIEIVRAGSVTAEDLKNFGVVIKPKRGGRAQAVSAAPGQMSSHYAPATRLRLFDYPEDFEPDPEKRYGLLSFRGEAEDGYLSLTKWAKVSVLSPGSGKMMEAAIRFFFLLRELDNSGVDEIIAEPIAERGLGLAMMDRLRRASAAHDFPPQS
ncbi:MAG: L-threonylcarbamoyladenylate synthase [Verrucomicrobiales bacterium]|jgi:L-threonylcarbamoyladenylate synthase